MVWQSVLRSWVQQQARQRVYEAVNEAAAGARPQAGQTAPCDVAVVFALGMESGGLEDLLSGVVTTRGGDFVVREGRLEGRAVVLMQSGVGLAAAGRATQALIAAHRPSWIISAGFAGALDPALARGHIVLADSLADSSDRRLAIDLKVNRESLAAVPGLHVGRLLSIDKAVCRPADKKVLGEKHRALAVDMESWAVGEVCRQAKTRFLAVRIITDALHDELPLEVEHLARQTSRARRLGAATAAIFRRPSSAKDMLALKERALLASDRLAKFLSGMIVQLVPDRDHKSEP